MDHHILSREQCLRVMKKHLGTDKFNLLDYSIPLMAAQHEGLLGEQYIVKIRYSTTVEASGENVKQFFLKRANGSNVVLFEYCKSIQAFEKEQFWYETLVTSFEKEGIVMDIVPKCYLCENYTIVLEDVSLLSYRSTPKNQPLDLNHCECALRTLAKFHAASIILEERQSARTGRKYRLNEEFVNELTERVMMEDSPSKRFMECTVKGLFMLIEAMPESTTNKEQFAASLEAVLHAMFSNTEFQVDFRSTVRHDDVWSNNFLFKYDADKLPTMATLIDFQTLGYGPPSFDVMQFIYTNTKKSLRDQHFKVLLKCYHDHLTDILSADDMRLNDDLSWERFAASCEEIRLPAKIRSVIDKTVTWADEDILVETAKSESEFSKFLFEDRARFIVDRYNANETFRDIMNEDILELASMLEEISG